MLTRETFTGPWAGLPVAWTNDDRFDEATYRADVARCCEANVPGVYTGGTTGEFYAMEFDEFKAVTRATVEECHARGKPAMIGCTSTYNLGAARRAAYAAQCGADAIQVALPFWMEIGDAQIVPFFKEVVDASGGLPLSIYETMRAKKALTLDQHRAVKDAVPSYLMVKANEDTVGRTPDGCRVLSEYVNVFVGENEFGSARSFRRQGRLQFRGLLEPAGRLIALAKGRAAGLDQRRCHVRKDHGHVHVSVFARGVWAERVHRHGVRSARRHDERLSALRPPQPRPLSPRHRQRRQQAAQLVSRAFS